ncbi:MAG: M28 family peptidase, partial [Phycisphaerales bacterium]|nr:M28 family peptidase [Phycisphaerales bacterium]
GGVLVGKGNLAGEWVIIGGHYDHVGYGRLSGASPNNVGILHPGADDNGSGATGVLLIARNLAQAYAELPEGTDARSVLFLEFAGEEMGLLGSKHYVENMDLTPSQITCMLNLDMIGRVREGRVEADGMGSADEIEDVFKPHFEATSLNVAPSQGVAGNSDHASFYRQDIPVSHFFTGLHPDYHKPGDTFEKINFEGAVQVCHLIESIAMDLATRPERLTYSRASRDGESSGPSRTGAPVRLGIAPGSYGEDDEPGVEVGDVFEGTSAADGGMKAGDRMIRWNGEPLNNVGDMMAKLMASSPGEVAEIVVVRDGEEVTLKVPLKAPERER